MGDVASHIAWAQNVYLADPSCPLSPASVSYVLYYTAQTFVLFCHSEPRPELLHLVEWAIAAHGMYKSLVFDANGH
jgi:hypothetical protein